MPCSSSRQRYNAVANNIIVDWVASEDHVGALPAQRPVVSESNPSYSSLHSSVVRHQSNTQVSGQVVEQASPSRPVAHASTQAPEQERDPAHLSLSPSAAHQPVPPDSSFARSPTPTSPNQRTTSSSRTRRTRSQVVRDSYDLLWREYLALTATPSQEQGLERRQLAPPPSGAATSAASGLTPPPASGSQPQGGASTSSDSRPGPSSPPNMSPVPSQSTIMQGPQPFDKPKGLGAVLIPLLCPPTDFVDMQLLTKLTIRTAMRLASVLTALSFAIIPAWLWLVRHELMVGHKHDAALVAVAGLLLFLAADTIQRDTARAAAARGSRVFSASDRGAYQLRPGQYSVASTSYPAPAAGAAAAKPSGSTAGVAASRPAGVGAAAGSTARGGGVTGAARGAPNAGHAAFAAAAPVDPMIRQVKQRIIKLEKVLFGNELTEGDIGRDALVSRVQMLCTEVGVPFGGPGGSSAKPTATELDEQLVAVEKALGV